MSVEKNNIFGKTFSSFSTPSKYCRVYSKNYEKATALEFELDRSRDMIMKLKNDLSNKNKEIHLLKINKLTIEEEHYKTLKTLKEFLKKSDNLTKETYKTIEKKINENKNLDLGSQDRESEKEESFPSIKRRIKLQNKNKKKMKDFIKIDSLKQHIYNLNEELNKKNNIISELKNNKKATGYKELQNNFLSSCNEIKEMRKENMEIKSQIEDVTNLLIMERDDNKNLKSKLQEYKKRFQVFKELSIQKVKKLDDELNIAKEKERSYNIKKNGEKSKEKYNDYIKSLEFKKMQKQINDYELDLKKNNDIIRKYKSNNFEKKKENKKLISDKNDLIFENQTLKQENEVMKKTINNYKKKIKNYEKEEKMWKGKEKEMKNEIEKLQKKLNLKKNNQNNDVYDGNKSKIFCTDVKNKDVNVAENIDLVREMENLNGDEENKNLNEKNNKENEDNKNVKDENENKNIENKDKEKNENGKMDGNLNKNEENKKNKIDEVKEEENLDKNKDNNKKEENIINKNEENEGKNEQNKNQNERNVKKNEEKEENKENKEREEDDYNDFI